MPGDLADAAPTPSKRRRVAKRITKKTAGTKGENEEVIDDGQHVLAKAEVIEESENVLAKAEVIEESGAKFAEHDEAKDDEQNCVVAKDAETKGEENEIGGANEDDEEDEEDEEDCPGIEDDFATMEASLGLGGRRVIYHVYIHKKSLSLSPMKFSHNFQKWKICFPLWGLHPCP